MARSRRLRMFHTILFTLKFKGFRRKNFVYLLLASVIIVFQVAIVSKVLIVKSLSKKLERPATNFTANSSAEIGDRRVNDQNIHSSVPVLKRSHQLNTKKYFNQSLRILRNRLVSRSRKQKQKSDGSVNNTRGILNSTVSPTLDYRILHEYYPPVNFSVVIPHVAPKLHDKEVSLVVLINSATDKNPNAERRKAIRKTWGNMKTMSNIPEYSSSIKHGFPLKAIINHSFKLVFLMGKSDNETLNAEIEEEARIYNDLMIGDFEDNYNNLIIKVYMGFKWAEKTKCKYILKGDDDIYINLNRLMMLLNQAPARFFGGYVETNAAVLREISDKHAISKMYYSEDYYPPYCGGAFYIFTHNLLPQFLELTEKFKPFHIEDAYLGILLREMGIQPLFLPGFHLSNWMVYNIHSFNPCDWATAIALGHKFNSSEIDFVHAKLLRYTPSRLTGRDWQACRRKTHTVVSDNMLPTIYGILFSLAMVLVYITVAFLPSRYEHEEENLVVKKKRRHYYPFVHRSTT